MTAIEELTKRGGGIVLGLEGLKVFAPTGVDVSDLLTAIRAERLSIITDLFRTRRGDKNEPSIKALAWLLQHRQELDSAGWSRASLYQRTPFKVGVAWVSQWHQASTITLDETSGAIRFIWTSGGRQITQRALPPPKRSRS